VESLLISHVWNDELYLIGWLKHHYLLFDRGVIIYYESSDSTLDILKEYAPSWEIIKPRQAKLYCEDLDKQIEEIEASFNGWKLCLTVTEYLLSNDINSQLKDYELKFPDSSGFYISGYGLVDEQQNLKYDKQVPLVKQRSFGFDMKSTSDVDNLMSHRNGGRRYFHKSKSGNYSVGRHTTKNDNVVDYNEIKLARAFFSPYNDDAMMRKLKMGENFSELDKKQGYGSHHYAMTRQDWEVEYNKLLSVSFQLDLNR